MKQLKYNDIDLLKTFLGEFFDFEWLVSVGFFQKEWKDDPVKQADRICEFFGFETVYEYGAEPSSAHFTYADEEARAGKPFVEHFPSIYDDIES